MDKSKGRFKKIFLVDINPGNDDITKDLVMGDLAKTLKQATNYQHVVILSHSNLFLLKKMIKDIGITNCFIVSDCGARIYNNQTDEMIYDNFINQDDAAAIIHYGVMSGSSILASSSTKELVYGLNLLDISTFNKKHYLPLPATQDYKKFIKFTNSTIIHSVLLFFPDFVKAAESRKYFIGIQKDWNFSIHSIHDCAFILTSKQDSKYHAVIKLMSHLNIYDTNLIYYYAFNNIDASCFKSFKNHWIHQDIVLNSEYYKDINIQLNTKNLIENLKTLFLKGEESVNTTFLSERTFDKSQLKKIDNIAKNTRKIE